MASIQWKQAINQAARNGGYDLILTNEKITELKNQAPKGLLTVGFEKKEAPIFADMRKAHAAYKNHPIKQFTNEEKNYLINGLQESNAAAGKNDLYYEVNGKKTPDIYYAMEGLTNTEIKSYILSILKYRDENEPFNFFEFILLQYALYADADKLEKLLPHYFPTKTRNVFNHLKVEYDWFKNDKDV